VALELLLALEQVQALKVLALKQVQMLA